MSLNQPSDWPEPLDDDTPPGLKPFDGETTASLEDTSDIPAPDSFPRFGPPRPARPIRSRSGCWLPVLGMGLIVLALVVVALLLPPFNLWDTIEDEINGAEQDDSDVETIGGLTFQTLSADEPRLEADGLVIEAAPESLGAPFGVSVVALAPADYLAGQVPSAGWACETDLPPRHALASPVYSLAQNGTPPDRLTLHVSTLPEAAGEGVLALYNWNAAHEAWEFVPAQPTEDAGTLSAEVSYLPRCVAIFRGGEARAAGVTLGLSDTFSPDVLAANVRIYPAGMRPTTTGALQGVLAAGFETGQSYAVIPLIQNFSDPMVVDVATVRRILENPGLRQEHARQLAAFVARDNSGFAGVMIDYRDIPADLRDSYSAFVRHLAELLHGRDRTLTIVLPAPLYDANTQDWDPGAYDWRALGLAADEIVVRLPLDPRAYQPDGMVQRLADWAATQVSPAKLLLGLSALSVEDQGEGIVAPIALDAALTYLGEVALEPGDAIQPGETVTARLESPGGVVAETGRDETFQTSYVRYLDAQGNVLRTMWITDPAALYYRLTLATTNNLGGVVVRDLLAPGVVPGLDEALLAFRLGESGEMATFEPQVAWTVQAGEVIVLQETGAPVGSASVAVAAAPTPTPPPAEATEAAPADAAPAGTAEPTDAAPAANEMPVAAASTGEAGPIPTVDPTILATGNPGDAFEVGGTIETFNANSVLPAGRTHLDWVQMRVDFRLGDDPEGQRRKIENAQANGFKILLTVVGDPAELASADREAYITQYADFVGRLALMNVDGIEVWRGMNVESGWPLGQIDPQAYVRLLGFAYNTIKTARPSALVITGAPVPVTDAGEGGRGDAAWNDDAYLQALAEAGAAQYADCVGVQYTLGATAPAATSGDPRGDAAIYYFGPAVARAHDALGGALPVCLTALGYFSPEGLDTSPAGFEWASGITAAQQAEWLTAAVQAAQADERIRLLIIWNLDVTGDAAGYAVIRPGGACPACEALAPVLE
ncbi:MAG: hypothetical protein GXY36_19750 [Chloroflexi bacterium]|nr:hypothetical protein [Chloroflexota bacterium]